MRSLFILIGIPTRVLDTPGTDEQGETQLSLPPVGSFDPAAGTRRRSRSRRRRPSQSGMRRPGWLTFVKIRIYSQSKSQMTIYEIPVSRVRVVNSRAPADPSAVGRGRRRCADDAGATARGQAQRVGGVCARCKRLLRERKMPPVRPGSFRPHPTSS